jgi:hypothetical protein
MLGTHPLMANYFEELQTCFLEEAEESDPSTNEVPPGSSGNTFPGGELP